MSVLFLPGFMGTAEDAPFGFAGRDWLQDKPEDVVAGIAKSITQPTTLIGYSMGARVALTLAAAYPEKVARLIFLSGTPGIDDPSERNRRLQDDRRLAGRIRVNFEAVLAGWYEQSVFTGLRDLDKDRLLARRAGQDPWQVASWLEHWSVGRLSDGWEKLASLPMPILALAGSLDTKYTAIAERIASTKPHCRAEIITGAGHLVQVDQPEVTERLINEFIEATPFLKR